jgi:hypothetical protein
MTNLVCYSLKLFSAVFCWFSAVFFLLISAKTSKISCYIFCLWCLLK